MEKNDEQILKLICEIILDKKGENIKILDISKLTAVADVIVIASGNSTRQLSAISDDIERKIKKSFKIRPLSIAGRDASEWILLDYNSIIVHLFLTKTREYYNLEELWEKDNNEIPLQKLGLQIP